MTQLINNAKVFFAQYDLTGYTNSTAWNFGAEPKDDTVFGDNTRSSKGGLKIVSAGVDGLWDSTPDGALQGNIGVVDKTLTIVPTGTAGGTAYFFKAMAGKYSFSGSVGDLLPFQAEANATGDLIRGKLLANAALTATAGATTTPAYPLAAAAANQHLHAAIHVFTLPAGHTLDVTVQSDTATSMGSPANQIAFTQAVGAGSEYLTTTGPITDTYYRISYAFAATGSPTGTAADFAVVVGVGS